MSDTNASPAWPVMSVPEAHALLTQPGSRFEMEEKLIRGVLTRTWKNAPATLREVFLNGRAFAGREFLVYEDDRATFEAFARATIALARQLQADGVKKGDRVAVIMRNLPEWPVAFWAGILAGAIVTPLNAWWTGAELEYGLADSGTKIAIVDDEPPALRRLQMAIDKAGDAEDRRRIGRPDVGRVPAHIEEFAHPSAAASRSSAFPASGRTKPQFARRRPGTFVAARGCVLVGPSRPILAS